MEIAPRELQNFYRSGVLGLRALQERGLGAQRFAPDADARWKAFRGELTDSDRLDLLLRDGAALHPVAFSAAAVFGLPNLATDEPFGPEWSSLPPSEAGEILRDTTQSQGVSEAARPSQTLDLLARIWGLTLPSTDVSQVVPASRVVVAGAGAIAALADHMAGRKDMDFGDQLLLVTDRPGERQLLGLASALCGSRTRPRAVRSGAALDVVKAAKFDRSTVLVISDDADTVARDGATRIHQELGA
jgi:hypothetical protein